MSEKGQSRDFGAGGERMFTSNWSAKLEYLHYDLGSANYGTSVNSSNLLGTPFTLGQSSSRASD
jgi:opacity protein-like surface antigen